MEKTIVFKRTDGTEEAINFKCTATAPLRYQALFKRNFLADLASLSKDVDKDTDNLKLLESLDLSIIYKIMYVMAKTADGSIYDIEKWLDQYESIDIEEVITELIPFAINTIIPEKKTMNQKIQK